MESVLKMFTFRIMQVHNFEYRLRTLNLNSIFQYHVKRDLVVTFKISNGLFISNSSFFKRATSTKYSSRFHPFRLVKQNSSKDVVLHFFSNRTVNRWNALTTLFVEASNVNTFKRYIKSYINRMSICLLFNLLLFSGLGAVALAALTFL